MPDSVAIAAIVGGIILLCLGLLDKGTLIKIFNAEISNSISNKLSRFLCIFFGTILIFAAISLEIFSITNTDGGYPLSGEDVDTPPPTQSFYATSYCSMTNVYGYGKAYNVNIAQDIAINNCIRNGGIPNCCSSSLRVTQGE